MAPGKGQTLNLLTLPRKRRVGKRIRIGTLALLVKETIPLINVPTWGIFTSFWLSEEYKLQPLFSRILFLNRSSSW
jgi:hypothetical protein